MNMLLQGGTLKPNARYLEIMQRVFGLLTEEIGIANDMPELPARFYRQEEAAEIVGNKNVMAALGSRCDDGITTVHQLILTPVALGCLASQLAHELIHLRQFLHGEVHIKDGETYFNGKMIPEPIIQFCQQLGDPATLPFEREPYARMFQLAQKVIARLSVEDVAYMNKFPCQCVSAGKQTRQCRNKSKSQNRD